MVALNYKQEIETEWHGEWGMLWNDSRGSIS